MLSAVNFQIRNNIYGYCHGNQDTSLLLRGFNSRLSSEELDLGPPLTINFVVWWVALEPQIPPS